MRPEYEPFFRPLLTEPDKWHEYGLRFAQLLKNLSLGQPLARRWAVVGRPLAVHLGAVINQPVRPTDGATYRSGFDAFRGAVAYPADRLHLATWQHLRSWLGSRQEPLCRVACQALDENDWL